MTLLYHADPERGAQWRELFAVHAPDIPFRMWPDVGDASAVRYLAAWQLPVNIAATFPNLEVLFSVGAGVDQLDLRQIPAHVPVVRMLEPGIVEGMVEYVTQAVLSLHRDLPAYATMQQDKRWQPMQVRAAADCRIGVLGTGRLGQAVLQRLALFGFDCAGWSRSGHEIEGVKCFAGASSLDVLLSRTDILVCLLPLTPQTQGMLNRDLFARLPRGASLIQTGRGKHLVQSDLLDALTSGQLGYAMLDVTDPEPLPEDHPFWTHPRVRITPHVASATRPNGAVREVLDNLRRHREGLSMHGLIDRQRGY
jgi:glyoxylate/hydroxypyruvate reductase